jgi:uncharacterized damage-inducible protein DinB
MKTFFLMLLFSFSKNLLAQTNDSLLNQLSRKWTNAQGYLVKMAESMPAEDFSYKPTPEVMSFQQQLLHIADNIRWLSTTFLFADTTNLLKKKATMDKADVINYLANAYQAALLAHYKMAVNKLDEKVSFFAGPMTRRQIFILLHDHQTHHAGEVILYLRLKGLKPPAYIGW